MNESRLTSYKEWVKNKNKQTKVKYDKIYSKDNIKHVKKGT